MLPPPPKRTPSVKITGQRRAPAHVHMVWVRATLDGRGRGSPETGRGRVPGLGNCIHAILGSHPSPPLFILALCTMVRSHIGPLVVTGDWLWLKLLLVQLCVSSKHQFRCVCGGGGSLTTVRLFSWYQQSVCVCGGGGHAFFLTRHRLLSCPWTCCGTPKGAPPYCPSALGSHKTILAAHFVWGEQLYVFTSSTFRMKTKSRGEVKTRQRLWILTTDSLKEAKQVNRNCLF